MKYFYIIIFLFLFNSVSVIGQDTPILSPHMTNSLFFNPALAGDNLGSVTFIYRKAWSNIDGGPSTSLLSAHAPFANERVGVGVSLYSDKSNIFTTNYGSASFAYRIPRNELSDFSFGVSAEYYNAKVDPNRLDYAHENDPVINSYLDNAVSNYDFSFGLNYNSRFFSVGAAYNKIRSGFTDSDNSFLSNEFYSAYGKGHFLIRSAKDMIQPLLTYRKLSSTADGVIDGGIFYTFNDMFTGGVTYGTTGQLTGNVGFNYSQFDIGYTYSLQNGSTLKDLGSSHQINVAYNFNKAGISYKQKYSSYVEKSRSAMSSRRKSLTKPPVGRATPEKFDKKWEKSVNNQGSPNKRFNPKKMYKQPAKKKFKRPKKGKNFVRPKRQL